MTQPEAEVCEVLSKTHLEISELYRIAYEKIKSLGAVEPPKKSVRFDDKHISTVAIENKPESPSQASSPKEKDAHLALINDGESLWDRRNNLREQSRNEPMVVDLREPLAPKSDMAPVSSTESAKKDLRGPYATPLMKLPLLERKELVKKIFKEAKANVNLYKLSDGHEADSKEYEIALHKEADRLLEVWTERAKYSV